MDAREFSSWIEKGGLTILQATLQLGRNMVDFGTVELYDRKECAPVPVSTGHLMPTPSNSSPRLSIGWQDVPVLGWRGASLRRFFAGLWHQEIDARPLDLKAFIQDASMSSYGVLRDAR